MDYIFISGNVPSSKNNKVWTGKRLIWSKRALLYKKSTEKLFLENKLKFLEMIEGKPKPIKIGFHFLRGTKHKWDFVNMVQTLQDLMVVHGYIKDDNTDEIIPFPFEIDNKFYSNTTQEKSGVFITIL